MDKAFNKIIKRQVKLTILSVIAVILLSLGTTYALFSTTHRNTTNQTISIGEINASVSGTPITLTDIYPIEESEIGTNIPTYTFTLTNPSGANNYAVAYELYLEDATSTIINTSPYNTYTQITSADYDYIMYKFDNETSKSLGSVYNSTTGKFTLKSSNMETGASENHTLKFWLSTSAPNSMAGKVLSLKLGMTSTAYTPVDPVEPNEPKLVTNLIPVVYDETSSKWKMSATTPGVWYDYSEQKWANAVTVTSAKRGTYSVGDAIEMSDILGMWVWIPRYEYKYTNLGDQYAGGTASLPGGIDINFISGTSTTETSGYIIHPAFRDASSGYTNNAGTFSAYQIGGWDSELTGFWMGKFETSSVANASSSTSSTDSDPIVKPNVIARRFQSVYYHYRTAQNIGTYHGISTLDTHMVKNSEWGAVAYLSQSTYGKYGNSDYSGANKEVYMNNSGDYGGYYTGRSMGAPASSSGSYNIAGTYEYNVSQNGTGASTTGNIYGIYDMAGGSWEYVMGWLSTASSTFGGRSNGNEAGFSSAPSSHKYWDEYTTETATTACGGGICYGHGLSETGGWYEDGQYILKTSWPWFGRGGTYYYSNVINGGTFYYNGITGNGNDDDGSRAVLV